MLYYKDSNNRTHFLNDIKYLPQGCTIIPWGEFQEINNPKTLEQAKFEKIQEIELKRDFQCVQDVQALNRTWQADGRSQSLLGHTITLSQAGLPLPYIWRDSSNNNMPITSINELLAIAGAMALQTQTAYSTSWISKQLVDNATTIQEVNLVVA